MSPASRPREYQFVLYSGRPETRSKRIPSRVRKHIMHDYFSKQARHEHDDGTVERSGHASERVQSMVASDPPESKPAGETATRPSDWRNQSPDWLLTLGVTRSSKSDSAVSDAFLGRPSLPTTPHVSETHLSECETLVREPPGAHRIDPFDVLSVKHVPNDLFYWHFAVPTCYKYTSPWIHYINVLWVQGVWSNAIRDRAMLYVLLTQAERSRISVTRSENWTRYLSLKGQALRALRERIHGTSTGPRATLAACRRYCV